MHPKAYAETMMSIVIALELVKYYSECYLLAVSQRDKS
jgi:hypothetical protein